MPRQRSQCARCREALIPSVPRIAGQSTGRPWRLLAPPPVSPWTSSRLLSRAFAPHSNVVLGGGFCGSLPQVFTHAPRKALRIVGVTHQRLLGQTCCAAPTWLDGGPKRR